MVYPCKTFALFEAEAAEHPDVPPGSIRKTSPKHWASARFRRSWCFARKSAVPAALIDRNWPWSNSSRLSICRRFRDGGSTTPAGPQYPPGARPARYAPVARRLQPRRRKPDPRASARKIHQRNAGIAAALYECSSTISTRWASRRHCAATAIGAHHPPEPSDAAEPADHQHGHAIALLPVDRAGGLRATGSPSSLNRYSARCDTPSNYAWRRARDAPRRTPARRLNRPARPAQEPALLDVSSYRAGALRV